MSICGRNTSTPPTPASTPSTNSARIHAGAEASAADTPSESRPYALLHQIGERRARPAEGEGEHQRQHGKEDGEGEHPVGQHAVDLVGNGRLMLALAGEAGFIERLFDGGVARVHHQCQRVDAGCFSRPRSTYASMAARMRPLCASESCAEARISSSPSNSFTATQVVGGAKSSSPSSS